MNGNYRRRLTAERARERLDYDPETGVFVWKPQVGSTRAIRSWNAKHVGKRAGSERASASYRSIGIDGVIYMEHRLAWLYVHGEWPAGDLDHINLIKGENRIANLRPATVSQNVANVPVRRTNKSGLKGVHKYAWGYTAKIVKDGVCRHLGSFSTAEAAHAVYAEAARATHGEFARVK